MLEAVRLLTEYKVAPLGMDEPFPRFCYQLTGEGRQTAYRICVTQNSNGKTVWDSGKVPGSRTIQISYAGEKLQPCTRYDWQVQVWDENDTVSAVSGSSFETGLLDGNWQAKWISDEPHCANQRPVNIFRKVFPVPEEVVSARLYITALGLYSAAINGKRITENCFTPGWTQYHERVQYQAYDVTGWLQTGEKNILSVRLGEGWYCGRIARRDRGRISYGDQPLLKAELHLETSDGEKQVVITDENWEYRPGSILLSDIYDGEHECAFLRDPAWESSFEVHPWVTVFNKELSIVWQSGAPVRPVMILKPESIRKRSCGTYIVDFGQNFTGRERITLKGAHAGDVIRIRHGEMLYDNGALYTENLRTSCAASIYEANDEPVQIYEPEFTFFGFRYLEICGWNGEFTPDCIEGVVLASDLPQTGKFRCSNELLNQLYSNIVWGQRSNFLDIPSDCPQRDERVAWTGDTQVFCNVATYNMFSAEFYRKWIDDLNLSRDSRGAYPIVAPIQYENWGEGGTVSGWSDAALIVPWQMYLKYGDKKLLEQYFGNMETYLDNQVELAGGYIVDYARFGDWLNIDAPTSSPLISTAYLAGMNRLLARIARVLGKNDAAEKREEIAGKISHACRERFLTSDGELTEKTQTAALFFLHFDIVQEKAARQKIFDFLVADIFETRQGHLSTGFLGTPLLLRVLTENGRSDLAYKLLQQTTYPGWLYPVTQGATTMWERWNSWTKEDGFASRDMNSFNHYAYGAVGEWFYETICGIQPLEEGEGFQKFRLAPEPGGGLTFAEAEYHSMYGMIRSSWEIRDNKLLWHFTVPCNTSAEIVFPGELLEPLPPGIEQNGKKGSAAAGNYTLVFKFNN